MPLNAEQTTVLSRLVDAIPQQPGTVLLTHDVPQGSETLCRELLRRLPPSNRVGWVLQPRLSLLDFVRAVCHAFRVHGSPKEESSLETMQDKLLASVQESRVAGKTVVLVISDAHLAPFFALNHLSRLNADHVDGTPLMHLVLLGESTLLKQLEQTEWAMTRKAVVARYPLDELAPTEPMPLDSEWLTSPDSLTSHPADLFLQEAPPSSPATQTPPPAWTPPAPSPASRMGAPTAQHGTKRSGAIKRPPWIPREQRKWAASAAVALLVLLLWWLWPASSDPDTLSLEPVQATEPANPTLFDATAASARATVGTVTQASNDEPAEAAPSGTTAAAPVLPAPEDAAAPLTDIASPTVTNSHSAPSPLGNVPRLGELLDDQAMTWPLLGQLWGVNMRVGDEACDDALRQGVQCFRSNDLDFDQLRAIDRPAMLLLQQDGVVKWVRLLAIDATHARMASSGREWVLPLNDLRQMWKSGALATLWRLPPGQTRRVFNAGPSDPAGLWLHEQLKAMQAAGQLGPAADNYADRVKAFQNAHNLRNDGRATPTTFVMINRMRGVDEPNLSGPVR